MKTANLLIAAFMLLIATALQAAEVAGKVGYMNGTLVAQRTDGTIMVLGPKSEVLAGDMLVTAKNSYAQVQMSDGSQMTLRPNSNLKIEAYQFRKEEPKADNAIFRLLKGGFRAVTGLIGKRGDADAYKVRAAAATIGIRGTDFSSRLCVTKDCKDDVADAGAIKPGAKQPAIVSAVVGRVMLVQGDLSAKESSGKERKLLLGAPVYEGDALSTGKKSYAVVAFRDESRVTLQESTVFQVEKFKYDKVASQENAVLRLLKGGVRVVTGLIGRVNHDNYQFKVATATIGIRGTGLDAWCNGPCASGADNPGATQENPLDGAGVYVWSGEVVLVSPGASFVVAVQQAAIIARDTGNPVSVIAIPRAITENSAPRPDSIPFDMKSLFGSEADAGDPGLYVTVHEGHVILTRGENSLDLGRGETGFTNEFVLSRLSSTPGFLGEGNQMFNNDQNTMPGMNENSCVVLPN